MMLNRKTHTPIFNIQLKTFILLFVSCIFILDARVEVVCAQPPSEKNEPDTNPAIKFYQNHISGIDGNRCPMYPHCSGYSAQAIRKHGFVLGWIMACDRLLRCGKDEGHLSPHIKINGRTFTFDPVSANDFWWFSPQTPPRATDLPTKHPDQPGSHPMPDVNPEHQR